MSAHATVGLWPSASPFLLPKEAYARVPILSSYSRDITLEVTDIRRVYWLVAKHRRERETANGGWLPVGRRHRRHVHGRDGGGQCRIGRGDDEDAVRAGCPGAGGLHGAR